MSIQSASDSYFAPKAPSRVGERALTDVFCHCGSKEQKIRKRKAAGWKKGKQLLLNDSCAAEQSSGLMNKTKHSFLTDPLGHLIRCDLVKAVKIQKGTKTVVDCMFKVCIFLPRGDGRDEKGRLVDLAGGYGMCGRGLREVETGWRDCVVIEGERHIKLHMMNYRSQ